MFEPNRAEERGQVGIGTLIVFIAMVLVAAIAAGVLINTAGFLQTQAEATGEDSTALVSERINVNSEVGIVAATEDTLDELRIAVTGAPGADQIDLAETTLQVVGPGGQENLVFSDGTITALELGPVDSGLGNGDSFNVTMGDIDRVDGINTSASEQQLEITVSNASDTELTTTTITNDTVTSDGLQQITFADGGTAETDLDGTALDGGLAEDDQITVTLYNNSTTATDEYEVATVTITTDGSSTDADSAPFPNTASALTANEFAVVPTDGTGFETEPVLSENDDYTIVANPDAGAFQDGNAAFGQGDDATVDIVSPAGATTRIELSAPDLFSEVGEAVLL